MQWHTPLTYIKGIGPQRALWLKAELNIETLKDLLFHFPFRYNDRTLVYKISEITEREEFIQIKGNITKVQIQGSGFKKRLHAVCCDDTGCVELVWFKGVKWMEKRIVTGSKWVVFGKATRYKNSLSFAHPELTSLTEFEQYQGAHLDPVYSTTEFLKSKSLDSNAIKRIIRQVLSSGISDLPECLPELVKSTLNCISRSTAFNQIHFPKDPQALEDARKRLKYEEMLALQLRMQRLRLRQKAQKPSVSMPIIGPLFNTFYSQLGFELTQAQKQAIKEIHNDLKQNSPMNRLLQGDVGSGKTIVAVMAAIIAHSNGYQTWLMVPTEILAQQHYQGISNVLNPLGIQVRILTGSTAARDRHEINTALRENRISVLIGTHALIEDGIPMNRLGLVIIDEQHRFGVAQRAKLTQPSMETMPHVLVMTATPIPRTLAMTVYGDLDCTLINELPPGRKPIITRHATESQRLSVLGFMRAQIEQGRQIYVVYPLIEESETLDYQNLQQGYESLVQEFQPPHFQISIVHGKMSNEQKTFEMNRFVKGQTQIMVATTVIEVGVNVPNASVMVIESSERFGLAQLHQLRGRVGRGTDQSYCILMTGLKLSQDSRTRMKTMVQSQNGFEISEMDLKLRGPGSIEGTRQSGLLALKLTQLAEDSPLIAQTRELALRLVQESQHSPQFPSWIQELLSEYQSSTNDFSRIA